MREDPPGSGSWQGRLPKRVDPYRRAIPGRYPTQTACRRALNKAIADLDAGRLAKPQGKPADTVRRLRQSVEEYIEDRRTDAMDPIAVNTVRDYTDTLKNVINHPRANLGRTPLDRVDGPALDKWLRLLHGAGVSHRRSAKGFAIVRATMGWEVRQGRIAVNVARQVRRVSTKKGRAQRQTADPVLLPSWSELAALAAAPKLREDRLLLLTIAWCGLRWAEAVSLGVTDVWPVRPRLSVRRTFIWDATVQEWEQEVVKAGLAVAIPMPTPLWEALRELAESRSVDERMGGDLLFRPVRAGKGDRPQMIVNHTNWTKRVWDPARKAAGLGGDSSLSELDPRRRALHIKDLRAYAASVVVDAGGTAFEAAALLRHSDVNTTNKYYARAMDERSQDPARSRLRVDLELTLAQRIDALWDAWCAAYPEQTEDLFRPDEG